MRRYTVILHDQAEAELLKLYGDLASYDRARPDVAWNYVSGIRSFLSELSTVPKRGTVRVSRFKILLSTMLASVFLKHRSIIIQGHEGDRSNAEDVNTCGYPFEEHGYTCRSLPEHLTGTLLSYKIERPVYKGFAVDTEFSLNAISPDPQPLEEFEIDIDEAKLAYLKSEKIGSLEKAGLSCRNNLII